MSLFPLFHWLHYTEFATAIRESELVYPIVLTLHLASIAVFGGMILMTDLRLLGITMKSRPIAEVVASWRITKRVGFVIMVTCGILLGSAKAELYYPNPFFWTKMTLLALVGVHALVFRGNVYKKAAEFDQMPRVPGRAKAAAVLSLLLWSGLVCMGRWIAYWEPKKEQAASHVVVEPVSTVKIR
jgi:Family of unknown function (DUF6644)